MQNYPKQEEDDLSIAVIGMSCRFPGAPDPEAYWQLLAEGRNGIKAFSDEELLQQGVSKQALSQPSYVKHKPIIEDIELFDAQFFGYNPREAELLAPQYRLFMEYTWSALEDAGYNPETYPGLIGLYAGANMNDYLMHNLYPNRKRLAREGAVMVPGIQGDYFTMATSFKLNLKGPSITVQTFCSTSAVAVHLACQSLLYGECDMALAGAANVHVPQNVGYWHHEGGIISPDGHVRAFDADAAGTVFGNGVGLVVLRRTADAVKAGDHIYATILGSAVNNDGSLKVSFTAPSVDGQAAAIVEAMANAGIEADQIRYVETHGTGTALGDPIEVAALTKAYRQTTAASGYCAIGSVKPNIGHLDRASGIASVIKAVLALHRRQLPPSIDYHAPNPKIDFANSPFYVNTRLTDLGDSDEPVHIGLSSLGVGGTNVHLILGEAPAVRPSDPAGAWQILPLSARTEGALERATDRLAAFLAARPQLNLADVAFTLQVGRKAFNHRRVAVVGPDDQVAQVLESRDAKRVATLYQERGKRPMAWMFSGQGSQYGAMGHQLYADENAYRQQVDNCLNLLRAAGEAELAESLRAGFAAGAAPEAFNQTSLTQPALFICEYALAQTWLGWGLEPDAMIGHSVGEYVAATLAGVFSLRDALVLVATRARLMNQMQPGAMLAVALPEAELAPLLGNELSLAVVNGPSRSVVAGGFADIEDLAASLDARGVVHKRINTSHAFHSHMMAPMLERFVQAFAGLTLNQPRIPFVSNLTGTWITDAQATSPRYWADHLRGTVRFGDGLALLLQDPDRILIEVGPGKVLCDLAKGALVDKNSQLALASMTGDGERRALYTAFGRLWLEGVPLDWRKLHGGARRLRLSLPTYAFEPTRYWVDPPTAGEVEEAHDDGPLTKQVKLSDWFYSPVWHQTCPRDLESLGLGGCWLVLHEEQGFGRKLADRLVAAGADVVRVYPAERFAAREDGYELAPGSAADFSALVAELTSRAFMPQFVVHTWCLAAPGQIEPIDACKDKAFYSQMFLASALAVVERDRHLRFCVVSSQLWDVTGADEVHPVKGTLLGPARVIPQELNQADCVCVDLVLPDDSAAWPPLIERVLAEATASPTEGLVAYRGRNRWTQAWEPLKIDNIDNKTLPLRDGGVYLITGGLGGIGLVLADFLAQKHGVKLVLTSRLGLPPREHWAERVNHPDEPESLRKRIRQVMDLEEMGAEVMVIAADSADRAAMTAGIETVLRRYGRIHGVIHAAGSAGGGLMQFKTREMAEQVLAPKVEGTLLLEELLAGQQLDFLVLCSSMTSVLGGLGRVDYTAANAFFDVYAQKPWPGCRTVSINWDAWQEVGMAVDTNTVSRPVKVKSSVLEIGKDIDLFLLSKRYEETSSRTIYAEIFSAKTHWILDDHRVFNACVMPGVGYIEMVCQVLAAEMPQLQIYELFFLNPMVLGNSHERELNLVLQKTAEGYDFQVKSRLYPDGTQWIEHCLGKASADQRFEQRFDPAVIMERSEPVFTKESDGPPETKVVGVMTFGPHWQVIEKTHGNASEAISLLRLPEVFTSDLNATVLHPTLLDMAVSYFSNNLGQGDFLPIGYKRLRIAGKLPSTVYSYCVFDSSEDHKTKKVLTYDVFLLDESGKVLVAIEGFSLKRLSDEIGKATSDPSPAENLTDRFFQGGDEAILSNEGIAAFKRILTQPDVGQVVVSTKNFRRVSERAKAFNQSRLLEQVAQIQSRRSLHPRPNLPYPYVAPESEDEKALVAIWQELLGIEPIGIHDNFFDLGGDSILGLQIVSRARKQGLGITAPELFDHPTIAELARKAETVIPEEEQLFVEDTYVPADSDEPDFSLSGLSEDDQDKLFDLLKGS